MLDQIYWELTLRQIIIAAAIVIGFGILAWLLRLIFVKFVHRLTAITKTKLGDVLLAALRNAVVVIIVLLGFYVAAATLPQDITVLSYIVKGLATALSLMGILTGLIFIGSLIKWYRNDVLAVKKNVGVSIRLLSFSWILLILIAIWLAVMASLSIWGMDIGIVTGWLGDHGWRIALIIGIGIAMIVSMGEIIPRLIKGIIIRRPGEKADEFQKRGDTLSKVLVSTCQVFIAFIVIFMVLSELEIDITPFLASAGVAVIAIGFGAQSMVKDFLAGFFVLIENQYRVGDWVRIADVSGTVESITLRRTVLRDLDGIVHVVPNGEIRVSSNYTKEYSRVNINISVAYGEDLDRVISVINKIGKEMAADPEWEKLIINPPQVLRVDKLGDSGIDIKVMGDTQPTRQWEVMGELRLRLKKTFDEKGIEIPWPHTKIYFGNAMPAPNPPKNVKSKKKRGT